MWFKFLKSNSGRRRSGVPRAASQLAFEPLEARLLLTFDLPTYHDVGPQPATLVAADFNGDGQLDLAAAHERNSIVNVSLDNGDGTYQAPRASSLGVGAARSLVANDLNGDGTIDLFALNDDLQTFSHLDELTVLLGNGDGTFQAPRSVLLPSQFPPGYSGLDPVPQSPRSASLGDINGDGTPDLVATGVTLVLLGYHEESGNPIYDQDYYFNTLLGNGDGTFRSAFTELDQFAATRFLGDFNADGKVDVAYSHWSAVLLGMGNGDGTFQGAQQFPADGSIHAVADFDHDGNDDLFMASGYGRKVLLGNGDGTFEHGSLLSLLPPDWDPQFSSLFDVLGDVDADGNLDIVAVRNNVLSQWNGDGYSLDHTTRSVLVLLGNGDGTFASSISDFGTRSANQSFISPVLGDFDGDTFPDLALSEFRQEYEFGYAVYLGVQVARNNDSWTPLPPKPSITISDVSVTEGNTATRTATFTVTLSAAYSQPVSVGYATADGTAAAGNDYQAASGNLTFAPGEISKTITVPVIGDRLPEADETFLVKLSNPAGATLADGEGLGTIADDEPRISISDVTKSEGKKGRTTLFTFTVTLSQAYDLPVTMSYRTVDGIAKQGHGDYVAKTGTLTFHPGERTKTISVTVKGDSKKEAHETFFLDLFNNSSSSLFTKHRGLGRILNDD